MTYTTISGDMWDAIAHDQLGSEDYTGQLMAMNSRYIEYFIFPSGIVLQLPESIEQSANGKLPPWKQREAGA